MGSELGVKSSMYSPSTIRRLAPAVCPQCRGQRTFTVRDTQIQCRRCGYSQPRQANTAAAKTENRADPREHLRPTFQLRHRGDVDRWARAAYNTAQTHIGRKEWAEAREALERALEYQHDFLDAHFWTALLSDDAEEKHKHLSQVLAQQPDYPEAVREMMVLRGGLTADQARALQNPYLEPERVEAGGAVAANTDNLRCKVCGSNQMTVDEMTGQVVCESCGSLDRREMIKRHTNADSLTMALLKHRAQPVQWVVGERLLACESCGAQRTISAQTMRDECPFCGSTQIIERDALGSFQQPEGLVPFAIGEVEARQRIRERLGGWQERMRGLLNNNTVESTKLEGVYLPFWVFDAMVEIRRTILRSLPAYEREEKGLFSTMRPAYESSTTNDAMNDVMLCAVRSPEPLLTRKLGRYDLRSVRPYAANLLAKHAAQLYSIEFDEASLLARRQIAAEMRRKHAYSEFGTGSGVEVNIFPSVKQMQFQLLLMPVWVGVLHEADGDVRMALVNGQDGHVVLGKAKKPRYDD
jgi:predicted RNA-binding Zn-ribbon protein involved in translation (DUF1610 family)/Zn ribbon nucleic-acid-binding protein